MESITFDKARMDDLKSIVDLLADDELGSMREAENSGLSQSYIKAFEVINNDPNSHIIVVRFEDTVIGCAQLNFIAHLTYQGGVRAQVEGVRIHKDYRSKGYGQQLFEFIINEATQAGCHLAQLTTDKTRSDAYDLYHKLGFVNSHEGFKLNLISY